MQLKRLITVTALAAMLTAGGTVLAAEDFFRDIPVNHWAYPFVLWVSEKGIMTGPGGQTRLFQPNSPVTRAELAQTSTLLYDLLHEEIASLEMRMLAMENGNIPPPAYGGASREPPRYSPPPPPDVPRDIRTPAVGVTAYTRLTGGAEVPRASTSARGTATFRWTNQGLYYTIVVRGLTGPVTGAHFHRAETGSAGPILETIAFDGDTAIGVWRDISGADWNDIVMDRMYVNVHTAKFPDGEIRGQIQLNR